jgi:pyrroline-5-carboxylate reductase
MQIAIIGMGKMGQAIAGGLKASALRARYRIRGSNRTASNASVVRGADVVLLCVKPHQAEEAVRSFADELKPRQLLISICASVTSAQIAGWSEGRCAIVRAMPNTPCLIGDGMTVLAPGPKARARELKTSEGIFATVGRTAVVEEALLDGVTGLSGCGPAYIYLVIEALSEAGVKVGLPRQTATLLAAQTLLGSARMVLARGEHPAALKDEVTTPAGCTIDGLMALEEGKLRVTLIKAVLAAAERSRTLRDG